jgi:hypothetical protein
MITKECISRKNALEWLPNEWAKGYGIGCNSITLIQEDSCHPLGLINEI